MRGDTIAIAQGFPGEHSGLTTSITAFTRCSSTPSAESRVNAEGSTMRTVRHQRLPHPIRRALPEGAGQDVHGIAREHIDRYFECSRIAHLDQVASCLHDTFRSPALRAGCDQKPDW